MKKQARWIKSTQDAAKDTSVRMPWERGARRAEMIARRLEQDGGSAKVTLPPMPAGVFLAAGA